LASGTEDPPPTPTNDDPNWAEVRHLITLSEQREFQMRVKERATQELMLRNKAMNALVPVFRFWNGSSHFYTASEVERDKLITTYSHIWIYEGPAFYVYPAAVYRGSEGETVSPVLVE